GAGIEGGGLAGAVEVDRLLAAALRDLDGLALLELADELARRAADEAARDVALEAGAAVGDVEVAHRELADAVAGAEGGVADALHRELLARVRQGGARRVEDRVVLAAAQADRDGAGDLGSDPLLDRLAQHERLRL